jgi:hypothetical protein
MISALYSVFALDAAVISAGPVVRVLAAALVVAGAVRAWSRPGFGMKAFGLAFLASVPLLRSWSEPERFLLLSVPLAAVALLHRAVRGGPAGSADRP